VRHGEVVAAHHGTFYGDAEVPLSDEGLRESRALAVRLAAGSPARVYSSPLERALLLGRAVAEAAGVPLVVERDLRELHRGSWTFRTRAQVEADAPGALLRYAQDPEHGNAPDGERESELLARVSAALDRIAAAEGGRSVVLVTHAHVIRAALRHVTGWSGPESLQRTVPYLGIVELLLGPDGRRKLLSAPPGIVTGRDARTAS
jgi:broad specificity phosphatase PhoE